MKQEENGYQSDEKNWQYDFDPTALFNVRGHNKIDRLCQFGLQIVLPHGTIVRVEHYGMFLNLVIVPCGSDWKQTEGMSSLSSNSNPANTKQLHNIYTIYLYIIYTYRNAPIYQFALWYRSSLYVLSDFTRFVDPENKGVWHTNCDITSGSPMLGMGVGVKYHHALTVNSLS